MASLHKSKQYLFGFAKVLVLSVTFGYIYYRLQQYATQDFIAFIKSAVSNKSAMASIVFIGAFLTFLNWYFETLKWQTLVNTLQKIDFRTALKQTLAALTVSLATPNRIGDYGAKVLYFEKDKRKKILLLNFFTNVAQLLATIVFGSIGLIFCLKNYDISYSTTAIYAIGLIGISILFAGYYFRNNELFVRGFTITNTFEFLKKLPFAAKLKVVLLSSFRYLTFSSMFYLLLLFFGAEIDFQTGLLLIFTTYLLVSILPSIFIFDVVIRGGVALWLFSFEGISDFIVLAAVLSMWVFNFVIPSILGSVYVIRFQTVAQ